MKAKEIAIKGKVHDVGYRLFLLSEAESVFIEKFDARNVLVDGEQHLIVRVEGVEERIKRFIVFAESNYPPEASVEAVEVKDYGEEVRSIDSFRQSLMVFQLSKMAQAGVGMLRKQDETISVIKEESEKTREVAREVARDGGKKSREVTMAEGEKTREVVEKVREEVEKTREVVSVESEKTRVVLKEKIEEDVEWIKGEIIGIKATLEKVTEKVGVD
ncbi:MAG: acylphosphatase [Methanophagales archaeon]|nr:acylphosphatase [Methanophagales archaeon]